MRFGGALNVWRWRKRESVTGCRVIAGKEWKPHRLQRCRGSFPPTAQDLMRGRRSEIDHLNGLYRSEEQITGNRNAGEFKPYIPSLSCWKSVFPPPIGALIALGIIRGGVASWQGWPACRSTHPDGAG